MKFFRGRCWSSGRAGCPVEVTIVTSREAIPDDQQVASAGAPGGGEDVEAAGGLHAQGPGALRVFDDAKGLPGIREVPGHAAVRDLVRVDGVAPGLGALGLVGRGIPPLAPAAAGAALAAGVGRDDHIEGEVFEGHRSLRVGGRDHPHPT